MGVIRSDKLSLFAPLELTLPLASLPAASGFAEAGPQAALGPALRVPVLLPVALDTTYDYQLPPGMVAPPGSFILVPFGRQERLAVVWDAPTLGGKEIADSKLKGIAEVLDVPPLPAIAMRFVEWVAKYTLGQKGMVLRLMMGASAAFENVPQRFGVRLVGEPPHRVTPGRQRVIDIAKDGHIRAKSALAAEAGVSPAVSSQSPIWAASRASFSKVLFPTHSVRSLGKPATPRASNLSLSAFMFFLFWKPRLVSGSLFVICYSLLVALNCDNLMAKK